MFQKIDHFTRLYVIEWSLLLSKKHHAATSANAASTLSGDGIIAGLVGGRCAMNIRQTNWLYHSSAFIQPLEFAVIVSMTPLDLPKVMYLQTELML